MRDHSRDPRSIVVALALGIAVAGPLASPRAAGAEPTIELVEIASGLPNPVGIVDPGDGSNRLFIVLQAGRIVIWDGASVLPQDFLDISSLVTCCGERGLLGLAFHPNYASNGFFYVDYIDTSGNTMVARYHVSANPNIADAASAVQILTVTQPPFDNHKSGQLQFGPDGFLYIGLGDGGDAGDPGNRAQNTNELLGKILRIDVNGGFPYAIPPSNPFAGGGGLGEIWAYGLRNPWRFSFDRDTGDLLIADVGQDEREEVDFEPAGSGGGRNYGWRRMEGFACFNPASGCNDGTLTLPVLDYDHSLGCSITGGYRYRGTLYPELGGFYLYADFCSGRIWGARQGVTAWSTSVLLDTALNISTFGEDAAGTLYLAHRHATAGRILRVTVPGTPGEIVVDNAAPGVSDGMRTFTGTWCLSEASGQFAADSLYSCGAGADTYRWRPTVPTAGQYDVFVRWTQHPNRAAAVPVAVTHAGGTTSRAFDQRTGGGVWTLHGRYTFNAGTAGFVQVADSAGQTAADAVRLVPAAAPPGEIVIDNAPVGVSDATRTFTGTWCLSEATGQLGPDSLYSCGAGADTYRWRPAIPTTGQYDVFVRWTQHVNRSSAVPIAVTHAAGTTTRAFDERTGGGVWVLHGRYTFNAGTAGFVQVADSAGQAAADAVRFVPVTP